MGTVEDARRGAGHISGELTGPGVPSPRPRAAGGTDRLRTVVRTVGEILITLGVVVLLFVVYEVYITDLISAGKQRDATAALDNEWKAPDGGDQAQRADHFDGLKEGEGFAKLYIPAFGPDFRFTIVEGTTEESLAVGPGHYIDTAYPGDPGNFAVAGHRVGKGAPFNDIDLVNPCDAIIVETQHSWFIYRMLPKKDQKADWADEQSKNPKCANVKPLGGAYGDLVGQEIVSPNQGSVIATVPHHPDAKPSASDRVALLTLTTCHPKFSDRQRLIVHAVLDHQIPKNQLPPGQPPPEMKES